MLLPLSFASPLFRIVFALVEGEIADSKPVCYGVSLGIDVQIDPLRVRRQGKFVFAPDGEVVVD
jgi:hypothetical protein